MQQGEKLLAETESWGKKLFWVFSGFLLPFMHNEYKQYCGLSCEAVLSRIDIIDLSIGSTETKYLHKTKY